jgi:fatty-acyl-CoA synthase
VVLGVPTIYKLLMEAPDFATVNLDHVRWFISGGAPLPRYLIDAYQRRGVVFKQGYGLTEVGPNCFSLDEAHAVSRAGSIGLPNFYLSARVVDGAGRDCPDGAPGELWLRSEVVTPGYWRKPDETAAAITDGWFRTGDVVQRDHEGFYWVVDRKKNMFISGGENVYPAEVEQVLVTHDAIKEAAVIGVPDAQWGEVGRAFLVIHEDTQAPDAEAVRAFCRDRLAKYKIPKHIHVLPALPVNQAGKIDRLQLRELE